MCPEPPIEIKPLTPTPTPDPVGAALGFTEVLKAGVGAFDRKYVNGIVEAYQKESDYFDIDANDKIGLTSRGIKYCQKRQ